MIDLLLLIFEILWYIFWYILSGLSIGIGLMMISMGLTLNRLKLDISSIRWVRWIVFGMFLIMSGIFLFFIAITSQLGYATLTIK